MKKIIALFVAVMFVVIVSGSSSYGFGIEKKTLALLPEAINDAKMYCIYQSLSPSVAFSEQLRYGELAEMIEEGRITYADTYDPKLFIHANQVWHLSRACVELRDKLKKIQRIKEEVKKKKAT